MSHDEDEPQPEYCDCDGFHDGSCRSREIKRLQDKLAAAESNEATCHCGLQISKHTESNHTAVEMERPCPNESYVAGQISGLKCRDAEVAELRANYDKLQSKLVSVDSRSLIMPEKWLNKEPSGTPTFSYRNGEYFKDGKPLDVLLELCELTGDVDCYEGMKEGIGLRIAELEQEIMDLRAERDKWKSAALSESYDQLAALFEEQEQRLAKVEGLLNAFQQAVIHVTENGKTARSFSSGDGWAMVHSDRLTDLVVCEEQFNG